MEGLRTRAAKLAAAAQALNAWNGSSAPFRLAFLTDARGPAAELVARALPAGSALVLRDYGDPRRRARAFALRSITRSCGVLFLVGGDAALAEEVGADGVHWRADQLAAAQSTGDGLVTVSAHEAADLAAAGRLGADLAFLSPAFRTESHPETTPLGPSRFLALAAASPTPVLALGGVDDRNAVLLRGRNVAGVAAIGAFAAR